LDIFCESALTFRDGRFPDERPVKKNNVRFIVPRQTQLKHGGPWDREAVFDQPLSMELDSFMHPVFRFLPLQA